MITGTFCKQCSTVPISISASSSFLIGPNGSPLKRHIQRSGGIGPPNETEKRLVKLWEELLDVHLIGIHQNYFDLGGNSLLAVRLFTRIGQEFNANLPLSTLFQAQTVAALADILRSKPREENWSPSVAIQPTGSRPPFFCIHGGGGNVLIYRALSQHLGLDQPFYGLQSQGLDGRRALLTRIEDMAELYVRELRRVQPHGPYFLGGY